MNSSHLIWIIPLALAVGAFIGAFPTALMKVAKQNIQHTSSD